MTGMRWRYLSQSTPDSLSELQQIMLKNREINDQVAFFSPTNPESLSLAELGFDRAAIKKALRLMHSLLEKKEPVIIFGDYDADGICGTAALWEVVHALGIVATPFIPKRDVHGYGLSIAAIDEIVLQNKPSAIITVDNGIVAHEAVAYAKKLGITVIITDHHQPERENDTVVQPAADAVVHTTKLCGTTVAWIFAREIIHAFENANTASAGKNRSLVAAEAIERAKKALLQGLDVCGIATVADQVPLFDANRAFATAGITALRESTREGLLALFNEAGIDQSKISSETIGFAIAPRINAMGRLAHGMDALRLLCTKGKIHAAQYARQLADMNTYRQDVTQEMYQYAQQLAKRQAEEHVLIIASEEFHEGIIGLIAGRLVERFTKPAIVISLGKSEAKASARSIPGVNIIEFIRLVQADLLSVGGHPMAAGFSITLEMYEKVQKKLHQLARETIDSSLFNQGIEIECKLPWRLVAAKTVTSIEQFAPFGAGNPSPLFSISARVISAKRIGSEGAHLKLEVSNEDTEDEKNTVEVLSWRKGEWASHFTSQKKIQIAASLELNTWRGVSKVQCIAKDILDLEIAE